MEKQFESTVFDFRLKMSVHQRIECYMLGGRQVGKMKCNLGISGPYGRNEMIYYVDVQPWICKSEFLFTSWIIE